MKVIKNGEKIEMTYESICEDLGDYIPSIHFIEVTTQGRISFTAGKPDEVTTLIANVTSKGYMPSNKLKEVIRMERLNGFEMVDSNGCKLEVLVQNGIITVEYDSDHGRKVLFNEPTAKFASIADLTNELHEQNLEELEGAIWEEYTVTCPFCGETYEVPERPQVNGIDVGEWQALGVCNYLRETFRHECD